MKKINLSNISNILEDVVMMKMDIEALNDNNEKLPLNQFLSNLPLYKTIFMYKGLVIPFSVVHGKNDDYFLYCVSEMDPSIVGNALSEKTESALKELEIRLVTINYDFSKLNKKSIADMALISEDIMNAATYFIINDEYYM